MESSHKPYPQFHSLPINKSFSPLTGVALAKININTMMERS